MLFYNQIKKEFSQSNWKRGQIFYRQNRVKEVRLAGSNGAEIVARVHENSVEPGGKPSIFETAITVARGTISISSCTCQGNGSAIVPGQTKPPQCGHVAALSIWVVERGSLLRAGVISGGARTSESRAKQTTTSIPDKPIVGTPVLFVRAIFSNKSFSGLSLEGAVRYLDPQSQSYKVETLSRLVRQPIPFVWKNSNGLRIRIGVESIPQLQSAEAPKLSFIGAEALEKLALVLATQDSGHVVKHQYIETLELEAEPLKLTSLHIGKKVERNRVVSYVFSNSKITISSVELMECSRLGRLSPNHVWIERAGLNRIYKLETSLNSLNRLANRSGILPKEGAESLESIDAFSRLEDHENAPLHPLAAYRFSLELGVENFTVDQEWTEFFVWKKNFEKKKLPALPQVAYGFDLRDYQTNGLSWLWSLYHRDLAALLADDMGLGKTHQVMACLTSLYRSKTRRPKKPSLVIAPTSVVAAWKQKLEKYDTNLRWYVFHGKDRTLPHTGIDLVLTTYGILQKETFLRDQEWHIVVLDEAQAVKNPSTISSRASRILKCKFRIALTGTPVENQALDLWSIMEFLLPGYLGGLARFKRLYGYGRELPSPGQAETLRRLVSPFLLRRTKSQVLKELPEKTEEILKCDLTLIQERAYQSYLNSAEASQLRDSLETGSGKIDYASILALLTRLKQVCDHPKLPNYNPHRKIDPTESGKWETFEEIIHEALGSNLKVVVFTQYLGMLDIMGRWLETHNIGYVELRGDSRDRSEILRCFAQEADCKVFLCSLLAGGLGIDLTSASVCIHYDRWWNPAKENQATDRLHRIGQTRGVQVFKFQCPGTVEDRIASIIESKTELSGVLIEESPLGLKAFSREELLALLSYKRESTNTSST